MSNPLGLLSSFEMEGVFWKPSSPAVQLPGRLLFESKRGPKLHLHGIFADEGFKQGIIYGLVEGTACTLHKCFYEGSNRHLGQQRSQVFSRYSAIHLFMGGHFIPEEAKFRVMRVHFTGLEEWYFHVPFKWEPTEDQKSETAKFHPFECPKVKVPEIDAIVGFDYLVKLGGPGFSEMIWKAKLFLTVTPAQPQQFHPYFSDHWKNLQRLLALLVGEPVYPTAIQLEMSDEVTVELLFGDDKAKPTVDISFVQMNVLFPKIKAQWDQIVTNWFEVCKRFESPIVLFFGTRYNPVNVEADFIRLIQALESYHRLKEDGIFIPMLEYEEQIKIPIIDAIPKNIDPELRESLVTRIKYGNTLSFRKRLVRLFGTLPIELLRLVKFDDLPGTVKQLVADRNYLTHYEPELKEKKSETIELWELGKAVEVILEYLLFKESGVPDDVFLSRLIQRRRVMFNQPD